MIQQPLQADTKWTHEFNEKASLRTSQPGSGRVPNDATQDCKRRHPDTLTPQEVLEATKSLLGYTEKYSKLIGELGNFHQENY